MNLFALCDRLSVVRKNDEKIFPSALGGPRPPGETTTKPRGGDPFGSSSGGK